MKELCYLERHQRDNEANKIIQIVERVCDQGQRAGIKSDCNFCEEKRRRNADYQYQTVFAFEVGKHNEVREIDPAKEYAMYRAKS